MSDLGKYQGVTEDDILAHFGILGMKWGVRNEPGKGGRAQTQKSEDYLKSRESIKKGYKKLSTQELQQLSNRLNLERQVRTVGTADIKVGTDIIKAITAATTAVGGLYALSKTPLAQDVKKAIMTAATMKKAKWVI